MQSPSDIELSRRDLLIGTAASVAVTAAPSSPVPKLPRQCSSCRHRSPFHFEGVLHGERHGTRARTRHAHHAARRLARAPASHRHQEGLRPRPVRRLHGDRRRAADQFLPDAGRHARGRQHHHDRGPGTPDNLHPMQAAFVKHDGYQCGYCTPGQICSAVAVLDEIKAGIPSHVSADLTAPPQADRRRTPRAHERQHLPLRRLFQHRRGDHRSRREAGMKPFTYERAQSPAEAAAAAARDPGRQVHRRRHQPARPDEAPDRDADASDRRQRPRARQDRSDARGRPADRRAGAQHRSRRRSRACGATMACSRARCWPAPPASCATRRRPRATCCSARAAPISTTPTSPATNASPAAAARPSAGSAASMRSSASAMPASRPIRATWRWRMRALDATVETVRPGRRRAKHPDRRVPPPARRHAAHRDRADSRAS